MDGVRRAGFALMAVLSLLAITAGLVAGFAVLANLDNRKISNALHSPYATAKKNALRAVGDALAKLQAATGQDTAATAKADIFEITPAEHKHWVGAWRVQKSNEQSPTEQDTKIFLTWLISGNHYGENDSQNTPAENKRIAIIDPSRKHVPPVTAELVDAPGNSENPGQFAYWIDDQSLKIQCNLHNPGNLSRDLFSKQIKTIPDHWFIKRQCQGRYGTEMAENSADNPLTQNFLQNNPAIAGNPDYGWLLDYPNFSEQQRQYLQQKYHDFNAFSLGLLTDTRRGGFRKNLCDDHSGTYRPEIPNDAFIFAPPTSFPAPPTTWGYYKSFYNLGAEIASGNIAPRPVNPLYRPQSGVNYGDCSLTCSTDAAGYSTGSISGTHAADLGIPTQYGIYPICTAFKNYMILYYFDGYAPDNATSSGYGRYQSLRMQPGFYFENPYAYNLSSAPITIWQGAPFVSGPENNATERYQKQPTFRCKLSYADGTSDDGLYQNYPNSANDDTKVFPFLATDPDRYLRPIWDGMITTNFPRATAKYIHLNSHTSYIASGKSKKFTTHNSKDLRNYEVNDIRFYQSAAHASEVAASCQIHSYPSADQPGNFAPWPNDTDQWSPFYLRTMDGNGDIFQQICDVNLQYAAVDGPMADRNMQTSSLVRGKEIPLYLCCARLKQGPVSSADCRIVHPNMADMGCDLRPFANANPRAPLSCRTARQDDIASFIYAGSFFPGNGSWEAHWLGLSDANNNVYSSRLEHALFADYPKFRNLFDLPHPTHKILNLGFLQHMDVGCFSYHPSYAIGNSYQNPWIARDRFFQENAAIAGSTWPSHHRVEMLYDYSYCLNRALWDSYFYASYDPIAKILLNPNYKAFIGATESQLNSFDAAAAMAIRGAFNVNSTSVEAWATFFGGAIDSIGTSGGAEFSRIQTIESAANIGLRSLNKDQIRALAARVVEQIKKRGIAGSLGEFVNRKLVSKASDSGRLGTKGALQAAIDGTNINDGYGGDSVNSARGKAWFDDDAASGPFWAGAPEYLTQADILQSVATTLCARGDTFCIHAYGNALAKNGSKIAEARCEVLVQRTADLLDSDRPELGRKYRILAIKWAIPGKFL